MTVDNVPGVDPELITYAYVLQPPRFPSSPVAVNPHLISFALLPHINYTRHTPLSIQSIAFSV